MAVDPKLKKAVICYYYYGVNRYLRDANAKYRLNNYLFAIATDGYYACKPFKYKSPYVRFPGYNADYDDMLRELMGLIKDFNLNLLDIDDFLKAKLSFSMPYGRR